MDRRPTRPPFERGGDDALVAGVASGLARHLGISTIKVRILFAVLAIAGNGAGFLLYAAFWAVVPRSAEEEAPPKARDRSQLPALGALVIGGLLLAHQLGVSSVDPGLWPVLVVGAGIALVWRQADETSRARWLGGSEDHRARNLRLAGGVVLLVAGLAAFLASNHELQAARDGLVAILVVVAGLALTLAPWWRGLVNDLTAERRERIRSQERSELAAHLHDSVLQTLALIQRRADSPSDVVRLARSQERELRSWLYARREDLGVEGTLAGAMEVAAAEVEDRHDMPVEVVTVGDCPLDDRLESLVRAAREAMVNAAKFSGVDHVDVFVEVDGDDITVFVRDTGAGFDPTAVPDDRRGIAESIIGRMDRHGGHATIRSAPGEGAEVELTMKQVSA
ncbi:MAG: Phage shock protein (PspC) family protein [Acidimicrobiales bacterium]|nr:Phage shock protein (PspC) family protein [Acidimicrobiales bacterium]